MREPHDDAESFVSQDSWIKEEPQAYEWDGPSNDDNSEDDEPTPPVDRLLPKATLHPPPPEPASAPSCRARDTESDADERSEMSWVYTASESEYGQPLDFVIEGAHVAERIAAQTETAANVPVQFYVSSGEEDGPPLHFPLAESCAEDSTAPPAYVGAVSDVDQQQGGGTSDEVLSDSSFILERATRFAVEAPPRNFERYMHTAVTVPPRYGADALVDERPEHHIDASERHRIRAQLRQLGPLGAQLQVRGHAASLPPSNPRPTCSLVLLNSPIRPRLPPHLRADACASTRGAGAADAEAHSVRRARGSARGRVVVLPADESWATNHG